MKDAKAADHIARALERNKKSSLRHLSLGLFHAKCNEIYDAYMNTFEKMLESNYVLETLLLQGSNCFSVTSPQVTFLLSLNHSSVLGRKGLFKNVMQYESNKMNGHGTHVSKAMWRGSTANSIGNPWLESIIDKKDGDLSILYYLLGKNPNLIASAISC